ncbi:MBL fold metallo-hydrolase [Spirosoma sordidisoli]|uniref:MBL fold metallo-hydrolase n=1 Tax=Spirosoma sordidisoli TaxID=2502893 RepID=UPI0013EE0901|nr:MBL fold metallo-hydrolase [Spirosoma sordidisoli]
MKTTALREGLFTVNADKVFTPIDDQTDVSSPELAGRVVVAVQPFLVCTQTDFILLDTGLGYSRDGQLQILTALEREGVTPGQISKVILSHLHKDHTGGIGHWLSDDQFALNFPNATYYVQERELAFARQQTGNPSYHAPTLRVLENHPQVEWLHTDEGQLNDQIWYAVSGGHTPFHQTITIREGSETLFYGADEVPQFGYLRRNVAYKNDYDGKRARDSRKRWVEQGEAGNWTFLLYHNRQLPFATLPINAGIK